MIFNQSAQKSSAIVVLKSFKKSEKISEFIKNHPECYAEINCTGQTSDWCEICYNFEGWISDNQGNKYQIEGYKQIDILGSHSLVRFKRTHQIKKTVVLYWDSRVPISDEKVGGGQYCDRPDSKKWQNSFSYFGAASFKEFGGRNWCEFPPERLCNQEMKEIPHLWADFHGYKKVFIEYKFVETLVKAE